jgi:hypothetical protein
VLAFGETAEEAGYRSLQAIKEIDFEFETTDASFVRNKHD